VIESKETQRYYYDPNLAGRGTIRTNQTRIVEYGPRGPALPHGTAALQAQPPAGCWQPRPPPSTWWLCGRRRGVRRAGRLVAGMVSAGPGAVDDAVRVRRGSASPDWNQPVNGQGELQGVRALRPAGTNRTTRCSTSTSATSTTRGATSPKRRPTAVTQCYGLDDGSPRTATTVYDSQGLFAIRNHQRAETTRPLPNTHGVNEDNANAAACRARSRVCATPMAWRPGTSIDPFRPPALHLACRATRPGSRPRPAGQRILGPLRLTCRSGRTAGSGRGRGRRVSPRPKVLRRVGTAGAEPDESEQEGETILTARFTMRWTGGERDGALHRHRLGG